MVSTCLLYIVIGYQVEHYTIPFSSCTIHMTS